MTKIELDEMTVKMLIGIERSVFPDNPKRTDEDRVSAAINWMAGYTAHSRKDLRSIVFPGGYPE